MSNHAPDLVAAAYQLRTLVARVAEPGGSVVVAARTTSVIAERLSARLTDPADRAAFVARHLDFGDALEKLRATAAEIERLQRVVSAPGEAS